MTSPQKSKGNSWEREFCSILAKHLEGNWQRVPNSGAFTGAGNAFRKDTLTAKQNRIFKGDVIPDDNFPKLTLECKFYADFNWTNLLRERVLKLDEWIAQTRDSANSDDVWLLAMKFNRQGTFVAYDKSLLPECQLRNHAVYKDCIFTDLETWLADNKAYLKEKCS